MTVDSDTKQMIKDSIISLLDYCQKNDWAGFDPYDALNSRIFASLPFVQNNFSRLIFTQLMRRLPVNIRPIMLVEKGKNPKGLALFSSALSRLSDLGLRDAESTSIELLEQLIDLRSPKQPYYCWGYNFDWQTRYFLVPKFTPNIICTTFAGSALLDAYERFGNIDYLKMAISAGKFMLDSLVKTKSLDEICFSYTPYEREQVHNANLLGAAFLSRLHKVSDEKIFYDSALSAIRYSIRRQYINGAWPYAEHPKYRWIDNFHTGFNLVSLRQSFLYTGKRDFLPNIEKGLNFYLENFLSKEGIPKYYNNKKYPIDVHSVAQSIITLLEFKEYIDNGVDLALDIFRWAYKNMRSDQGYFYYQKQRIIKNKIPYMRWSQAWMLYSLSILAETIFEKKPQALSESSLTPAL